MIFENESLQHLETIIVYKGSGKDPCGTLKNIFNHEM